MELEIRMKKYGFTLVELMISVLVTSIVIIAAYALLRGTTTNFNNEDDRVQLRSNLRNTEMLLQRDIGRVAFRSNYQAFQVNNGPSDVNFQAFRHARVQIGTKYYSQITIVGDITDFGFFEIRRAQGKVVELNDLALSGLQNNDCLQKLAAQDGTVKTLTCGIGHCKACVNGSPEDNASSRFDEAFNLAFHNAAAVRITSVGRNKSVIRKLNNTTRPSERKVYLVQNVENVQPDDGFAALFLGDRLTPITAITYSVMENTTQVGEMDLVRCTHSLDDHPVPYSCSIVARNVDYFDVYPIVTGVNRENAAMGMANDKTVGKDFSDQANLSWTSANYTIQQLTGVNFRIGVHGTRPVTNPQYDETMNNARYFPPYFKNGDNIYNRAHVQSSAAIYSVQNPEDWVGRSDGDVATIHQSEPIIFNPTVAGG